MYKEYAELFKVLSDPNRLTIIELLIKGETCGCTLIDKLDITQPTLSHHLKKIAEVGLATGKKEGNKMKYYINKQRLDELVSFIDSLKNTEQETCEV